MSCKYAKCRYTVSGDYVCEKPKAKSVEKFADVDLKKCLKSCPPIVTNPNINKLKYESEKKARDQCVDMCNGIKPTVCIPKPVPKDLARCVGVQRKAQSCYSDSDCCINRVINTCSEIDQADKKKKAAEDESMCIEKCVSTCKSK